MMQPISEDQIKYFNRSIGSLVLLKPILEKMKIAGWFTFEQFPMIFWKLEIGN